MLRCVNKKKMHFFKVRINFYRKSISGPEKNYEHLRCIAFELLSQRLKYSNLKPSRMGIKYMLPELKVVVSLKHCGRVIFTGVTSESSMFNMI